MGAVISTDSKRRRHSTLTESRHSLPSVESSLDDFIARAHEAAPRAWDPVKDATDQASQLLREREAEVARLREVEATVRLDMEKERAALTQHIAELETRLRATPTPGSTPGLEVELNALRNRLADAEARAARAEIAAAEAAARPVATSVVAAPAATNRFPAWILPVVVAVGIGGTFIGRMLSRPAAVPRVAPIVEKAQAAKVVAPDVQPPAPAAASSQNAATPAASAAAEAPVPSPTANAQPNQAVVTPSAVIGSGTGNKIAEPQVVAPKAAPKPATKPTAKPKKKSPSSGGLVDPF